MPAGSSQRLPDEMDLLRPPLAPSLGGDAHPDRGLNKASSRPSSWSSSPKKNFPDCLVGRSVSCEDEGDMRGLRECFIAVSRGSGVSSRYLRVVDGSMAIVLPSAAGFDFIVLRREMGLFLVLTRFIITPSSESLSEAKCSSIISSSSSPLASTAMHCSTCSLK